MGLLRCTGLASNPCVPARYFRWCTTVNSICLPWKPAHEPAIPRAGGRTVGAAALPLVSQTLSPPADHFLPGNRHVPARVSLVWKHLGEQLLLFAVAPGLLAKPILQRRGQRSRHCESVHLLCRNSAPAKVLVADGGGQAGAAAGAHAARPSVPQRSLRVPTTFFAFLVSPRPEKLRDSPATPASTESSLLFRLSFQVMSSNCAL